MAFDLKKLSFGQLLAIAGGVFVLLVVITGLILSSSRKPPQKVVTKRPAQFESAPNPNEIEMEKIRSELAALKAQVARNEQTTQAAFQTTATAVDQQNKNIGTLDSNLQVTASRVNSLERDRVGSRVKVVKPDDLPTRPQRAERIAAAERRASSTRPLQLSNSGDYKVLSTVGNRAWIRNGNEEISVREGEAIPLNGQLVVKRVAPNGQVSVDVESAR